MNKAEIRAKVLAEAEAAIDGILGKSGPVEDMTMGDIVRLALASGQQVEAAVVEALSQAAAGETKAGLVCEECGRAMHYKGRRLRDVRKV